MKSGVSNQFETISIQGHSENSIYRSGGRFSEDDTEFVSEESGKNSVSMPESSVQSRSKCKGTNFTPREVDFVSNSSTSSTPPIPKNSEATNNGVELRKELRVNGSSKFFGNGGIELVDSKPKAKQREKCNSQ